MEDVDGSTSASHLPSCTEEQRHGIQQGGDSSHYAPVGCKEQQQVQNDISEQAFTGFVFNALSTVFVVVMGIFAKLAGQHGIPAMEIVLARSSTLLVFAFFTICWRRQDPRGNRRGLLVIRGLCGFTAISCWYSALLLLPLSDVMVFGFFTPLIVAILSPLLVKEVPSRMVLSMAPVCIFGVILAVHPPILFGGEQRLNTWGVSVALGQAFFASLVKLSVRELRTTETSNVIIFNVGWISTLGASAACILLPNQWVTPTTVAQLGLLAGTGLSAYAFQVCMTMGLKRMRAAPAAAIAYLSVVWGILGGLAIFDEIPTFTAMVGASIICLGTLAVVLQESWHKSTSRALVPAPSAGCEQAKLLDVELAADPGIRTKLGSPD